MRTTQDGEHKLCGQCQSTKHIDEFPKADPLTKSYSKYKNGIKPWCTDCSRKAAMSSGPATFAGKPG